MRSIQQLSGTFPSLHPTLSKVTSLETTSYNCIAYAAGDYSRKWWPDPFGFGYWPLTAVRLEILPAFQAAYESIGYELCGTSSLENGYEKLAVYSIGTEPTHAAKQMRDGTWSSKLGDLEDIQHTMTCFENSMYGNPAFFMRRRI